MPKIKGTCRVTGQEFEISDFEQEFLQKITPTFSGKTFEIPLPDLCPDERMRFRTIHRNEAHLYKNVSAFTGKPLVSLYRPESGCKVVTRSEWFGDSWDGMEYAQDFQPSKSFFEQFGDLQKQIPRAATVTLDNENSEYTTGTAYCKNCYLINSSENCEDCYYSKLLQRSKDIIDSSYVYDSELLYECFNCEKCFGSTYLTNCKNCSDSHFLKNCIGCQNCFGCMNLSGKSYYFMNEKCEKDEYEEKLSNLGLNTFENVSKIRERFLAFCQTQPHRYAQVLNCENCSGDFVTNSRECYDCYDVSDSEFCQYVQVGVQCRSLLDCSNMYIKPELSYQTLGTIETYNCHFCLYVFHSKNMWYSEQCFSCQDCFGCVGLRNKQYCIFNKQYSQEEYEKVVAEIISHMQQTGEWGQYFPIHLSPFAYNETVAQDYLPLNVDEAQKRGYSWHEGSSGEYEGTAYIPLDISQYDERVVGGDAARSNIDACLKGVLLCQETKKPYKIIRQELVFYIQNNLPIPRYCPDARHQERMGMRNPRKLFERMCDKCDINVLSTFSDRSPENIFCEKCFQAEMS